MCLFNRLFLHPWRWLPRLLLGFVLAASTVRPAHANDAQQVVVTLRDVADHGLGQVVISIEAPEGNVLAEGFTGRDGTVRLSLANPTDAIRLTVRGVDLAGAPLQLAASERDGITVRLLTPTTTIALRVEDDGTVLPDPRTMAEPAWIPLPPAPTRQPPAPTAASTTSDPAPKQTAPAEFVDANGQPIADTPSSRPDVGLLLGLVWLAGVMVIALWRIVQPLREGRP